MILNLISSEEDYNKIISKEEIISFLYRHLGEFGDEKEAISASLDYALSSNEAMGGFILTAWENKDIVGVVVMIKTGMKWYIPENILVYIAVHSGYRNRGIGKLLLSKSKEIAKGDIALHVEYENPAKRLYEREGFVSKYAEMRFTRE